MYVVQQLASQIAVDEETVPDGGSAHVAAAPRPAKKHISIPRRPTMLPSNKILWQTRAGTLDLDVKKKITGQRV